MARELSKSRRSYRLIIPIKPPECCNEDEERGCGACCRESTRVCSVLSSFGCIWLPLHEPELSHGAWVAAAAGQLMAQSRAAVTTGSQLMVTDFTGNTSLRDLGAKCAVFIQHPVLAMLSFVHNFPS